MATPVCAGVIAVLLEKTPLSPERVKKLQKTARRLPGYDENDQGSGVISLKKHYKHWKTTSFSIPISQEGSSLLKKYRHQDVPVFSANLYVYYLA